MNYCITLNYCATLIYCTTLKYCATLNYDKTCYNKTIEDNQQDSVRFIMVNSAKIPRTKNHLICDYTTRRSTNH